MERISSEFRENNLLVGSAVAFVKTELLELGGNEWLVSGEVESGIGKQ